MSRGRRMSEHDRAESARRVRAILETGLWPSGLPLAAYEYDLLRCNCGVLGPLVSGREGER